MSTIGNGVSLNGLYHEDSQYTLELASATAITDIDKAMSIDATAANTAKVAADGDAILGQLKSYEDRTVEGIKVGTLSCAGGHKFPVKSGLSGGDVVAVGKYLVGAGAGEVKGTTTASNWLVVEVTDSGAKCVAIKV